MVKSVRIFTNQRDEEGETLGHAFRQIRLSVETESSRLFIMDSIRELPV